MSGQMSRCLSLFKVTLSHTKLITRRLQSNFKDKKLFEEKKLPNIDKSMNFQMAPHKTVASLLQISSALISHQLLLLLIGKDTVEDGEEEKEEEKEREENVMRKQRDGGEGMLKRRGRDKNQMSDLGNNDLVEILSSLGLLTGMMEMVLDNLNTKIGTDKM